MLSASLAMLAGAPAAEGQDTLEWSSCEDPGAPLTECAVLEVPLDHAAPEGETIDIGIRRTVGSSEHTRQLWYLAGGPGDAVGGALERISEVLRDPDLGLYGIDHRGTGASARLSCPAEQAPSSADGTEITSDEWAGCIAHVRSERPDLDYLTVSQATHDLDVAIVRVGAEVERRTGIIPRVFLFGASYGSYWANRYLHHYGHRPAGVILDGVVPADWTFAEFDARLDAVARAWLGRCAEDAGCADRLGDDPAGFVTDVLQRLADGHCPALGIDGEMARILFGVTLMVDEIPNALVPVMAYRWGRCEWHDEMALVHFVRGVLGGVGEPSTHSPVLQRHVAMSELWNPDDPEAPELTAAIQSMVATTDVSASFAATYPVWPRYEPDPLDGVQAPYEGPLLMLHGGLDPTMSPARLARLRDMYDRPGQTLAVIPEAGHVTLNFSDCVRELYAEFLASPGPVDTICVGEESFVSFEVGDDVSSAVFGTSDTWGDEVSLRSTIWFKFRYRWLPLGIGFVAVAAVGRRRRPGRGVTRAAIGALGVTALVLAAYTLVASVPLLIDYRGLPATAGVGAIVVLQSFACLVLVRWTSRGGASEGPAGVAENGAPA